MCCFSYCVYDNNKVNIVQKVYYLNIFACTLPCAQSSKAYEAGHIDLAKAHAHKARLYTFASLAVGVICENVFFIILIIVVGTT